MEFASKEFLLKNIEVMESVCESLRGTESYEFALRFLNQIQFEALVLSFRKGVNMYVIIVEDLIINVPNTVYGPFNSILDANDWISARFGGEETVCCTVSEVKFPL